MPLLEVAMPGAHARVMPTRPSSPAPLRSWPSASRWRLTRQRRAACSRPFVVDRTEIIGDADAVMWARVLAVLPARPARIEVLDIDTLSAGTRRKLRGLDGFVLQGLKTVVIVRQGDTLQRAARGHAFDPLVLASLIGTRWPTSKVSTSEPRSGGRKRSGADSSPTGWSRPTPGWPLSAAWRRRRPMRRRPGRAEGPRSPAGGDPLQPVTISTAGLRPRRLELAAAAER